MNKERLEKELKEQIVTEGLEEWNKEKDSHLKNEETAKEVEQHEHRQTENGR